MFRVGQKVVCVDDTYFEHQITKGAVYQIHSINVEYGDVWLRLSEVNLKSGYSRRRFRPLIERKTDISVFKAMLTPAGKKERVDAKA